MIIYPAIDLRQGQVVRLREGDPNQQTIFSDDPLSTANAWHEQGATWLHLVNLDGALSAANNNRDILSAIAQTPLKVQFGGGIRSIADIEDALMRGASRVVVGTLALNQPEVIDEAVVRFGQERICVALDARDGMVTTHGWTTKTSMTPTELGQKMRAKGIQHALFTDVSRDGGLQGSNLDATIALGRDTQLNVIASGGVSMLTELKTLRDSGMVAGAVIGMALYTKQMKLSEALKVASGKEAV